MSILHHMIMKGQYTGAGGNCLSFDMNRVCVCGGGGGGAGALADTPLCSLSSEYCSSNIYTIDVDSRYGMLIPYILQFS